LKKKGGGMGIILWIIFGGLVGWIASMIMKSGGGIIMDVILGVVGAVVGGFVFSLFGGEGVTGFNLYSMIVAIIGAIIVVWVGRLLTRKSD